MSKRGDWEWTKEEKDAIFASFGGICAACGSDDPETLEADHWLFGSKSHGGVCLCGPCNRAKGKALVPVELRLKRKNPLNIVTHAEYKIQIAANRAEWGIWVGKYRGVKGNPYKLNHFIAPF